MSQLVSIIIPIFNRASLVSETLNSIINQTYTNWECIIVDDGSTDNTDDIVGEYVAKDSRIKFYKRPDSFLKGANSCRNYGFSVSSGELIQWFDSDDIMHKDKLINQVQSLIKSDKKASVCNFKLFKHSINEKALHRVNFVNSSGEMFNQFISGKTTLNTQIILFKRETVSDVKFDESLHRAQDLDFVYRVFSQHQLDFDLLNEELVYIRAHQNSITNSYHKGNYKAILSEVKVRKQIFEENFNIVSKNIKKSLLQMRLNSIRALLINGFYKDYKKEMYLLSESQSLIKRIKIFGLRNLGWFYNKTNKGLFFYGKLSKRI